MGITPSPLNLAPDIWVVEGSCVDFYSFPYSTRMVVVRLKSGGLWVWSPIALTKDIATWIDALGPIEHLVGPNPIHHLSLGEWKQRWPDAKLWGPQSLVDKRRDLSFDGALDDHAPADWAGEVQQFHFTNSRFLDEVVFVHLASRTAIFTDLSENFSADFIDEHWSWWQRPIARLWKIMEPYGYAPLELRLTFQRREEARTKLRNIKALKPERVVMAHGEIAHENGVRYLDRAFAWLEP